MFAWCFLCQAYYWNKSSLEWMMPRSYSNLEWLKILTTPRSTKQHKNLCLWWMSWEKLLSRMQLLCLLLILIKLTIVYFNFFQSTGILWVHKCWDKTSFCRLKGALWCFNWWKASRCSQTIWWSLVWFQLDATQSSSRSLRQFLVILGKSFSLY